jgi:predicted lipoprotein with Yx(FWY)xxD motif
MWQKAKNQWNSKRLPLAVGVLLAFACVIFQVNVQTASAQSVVNNAVLVTKTSPSLGNYLADPSGRALYTYGGDTAGLSNCSGACLMAWPAYQATGSVSSLPAGVGTIKRSDNGETQYTYQGLPLYYFASDSGGSVTGNGIENFRVAVPASTPAPAPQVVAPTAASGTAKPSAKLPTTGPVDVPAQLLAIGLLTLAIVSYQRSRRLYVTVKY